MNMTEYARVNDIPADRFGAFVVACALYRHCNDYHEGQWSERYSILGQIGYNPGLLENGPEEDSPDEMVYQDLASGLLDPADVLAWIIAGLDSW